MMNLAHQCDHGPLIFSRNAPTVRALKADTLPPLWWRDTLQLAAILRAAWRVETADYFKRLAKSFEKQDAQAIERALEELPDIGPRVVKRLGKIPEAIMLNVQQKAHAFWALHGQEAGVDTGLALKRDYEETYQKKLAEVAATQVKTFTQAHPERIVNDEIKRQIAYLNESKLTRAGDVARLNQRLERITSQKHNFEGMSSVHVSRLWQADGVMLAAENGVATLIGTGPTDQKCCPVCLHLVGIEVNVTDAVAKIRGDMGITDPDDYVGAWKFPRIKDIDNMSPQEVAAHVGPLPFPAHLRCRHSYTWGTLKAGKLVSMASHGPAKQRKDAIRQIRRGVATIPLATSMAAHLCQAALLVHQQYRGELPDPELVNKWLDISVPNILKKTKDVASRFAIVTPEQTSEIIEEVKRAMEEVEAVFVNAPTDVKKKAFASAAKAAMEAAKNTAVRHIFETLPSHVLEEVERALSLHKKGIPVSTYLHSVIDTSVSVAAAVAEGLPQGALANKLTAKYMETILKESIKAARKAAVETFPQLLKTRNDPTALFRGALPDPPKGKNWRWIKGKKLKKGGIGKGYWRLVNKPKPYSPTNDPKALKKGFLPPSDAGMEWRFIEGKKKKDGTRGKGYWRQVKAKVYNPRYDPDSLKTGRLPPPEEGKTWQWVRGHKKKNGDMSKSYWRQVKEVVIPQDALPKLSEQYAYEWVDEQYMLGDGTIVKGFWKVIDKANPQKVLTKLNDLIMRAQTSIAVNTKNGLKKMKEFFSELGDRLLGFDDITDEAWKELQSSEVLGKSPQAVWAAPKHRLADANQLTKQERGVSILWQANGFEDLRSFPSNEDKGTLAEQLEAFGLVTPSQVAAIKRHDRFPESVIQEYNSLIQSVKEKTPIDFSRHPDGIYVIPAKGGKRLNRLVYFRKRNFTSPGEMEQWGQRYCFLEEIDIDSSTVSEAKRRDLVFEVGEIAPHLSMYRPNVGWSIQKLEVWDGDPNVLGSYNANVMRMRLNSGMTLGGKIRPLSDNAIAVGENRAIDRNIRDNMTVLKTAVEKYKELRGKAKDGTITKEEMGRLFHQMGVIRQASRRIRVLKDNDEPLWMVNITRPQETFIHEYGHHVHRMLDETLLKPLFNIDAALQYPAGQRKEESFTYIQHKKLASIWAPTKYGATNFAETWAESYMLYMEGRVNQLHPDMVNLFDALMPRLQFGRRFWPNKYGPLLKTQEDAQAALESAVEDIRKRGEKHGIYVNTVDEIKQGLTERLNPDNNRGGR